MRDTPKYYKIRVLDDYFQFNSTDKKAAVYHTNVWRAWMDNVEYIVVK